MDLALASDLFTSYSHQHGASIVDYLLTPLPIIPQIQDFRVSTRKSEYQPIMN
eukprot:c329_g1_i1 orf=1-156(-)